MKMTKRRKVFLIVSMVVLLSIVFLMPKTITNLPYFKKIKYIADLLTGATYEEDISVEELIEAFVDKGNPPIYRKYAASKLGHTKKDSRAVEPLIGILLDKTEGELIRTEAAFTLGLIGDKRAIGPLLECLDDESRVVQINVLRGLTMFRDERTIGPLIALTKSEDPKKRAIAGHGLVVDTPEVITTLINLIREDPYFSSKYGAVESLGNTKTQDEEAFQTLLEVLHGKYVKEGYDNSEKRIFRCAAAIALGKIGDRRAVQPLIKVLQEEEPGTVLIDTAKALGNLDDKRALGHLRKKMEECKDENWIMKHLSEAYEKITKNSL